jgi:D-apionate oxidoisomerase
MAVIALFGAGGKIGFRIAQRLKHDADYTTLFVEAGETGKKRLRDADLHPSESQQALEQADVVILAVPDVLISQVARELVPRLKPGALVITLDPAAPFSSKLPSRDDLAYFVTHPCHPPVYNDEVDAAARNDYFGGTAKQHIVCALLQGSEAHYSEGERIARKIFAPVMRSHRITVEQMAILEPALAESVTIPCMMIIREALDVAVQRGVPFEAARDFLLGHINIDIAILFGFINAQFSDGAKMAALRGMAQIIQPDWKKVFEAEYILKEVQAITETTP